ncbi:DgyrCDS2639 [Dimorphilus gyrociliatus]|uniref:DgyrCDS2639 n=1 Tax=Dimorphilus gyrociliatus TaxID=2664684 RepID=A0A7I8VAV6_9ANNE|nr:DgyrCDS2639 [Dimorphilus gyrociliatus]
MGCFGKKKKNEYKLSKSVKQERNGSQKVEFAYKAQTTREEKSEGFSDLSIGKKVEDTPEKNSMDGDDGLDNTDRQHSVETGVVPLNN